MRAADKCSLPILLVALLFLAGCSRMATPPAVQMVKDADARVASGDFLAAIALYEKALDGSPASADLHYKLALLYDDKMGQPLNALHHFKRCLTLAPTGPHAEEVKTFMKRDELTLLTQMSGDSVVTRAEATRLKNENLTLRQQLEERRLAETRAAAANKETRTRGARAKTSSHSKRTSQR
jgi:tetratricopeptide (TPR) repeat protein